MKDHPAAAFYYDLKGRMRQLWAKMPEMVSYPDPERPCAKRRST